MGRKIVLTGTTLTDTTAPRLAVVDQIESAGSLLLVEPMHPTQQWESGVPANGATIPNLLKDTLATGDASFVTDGGLTATKGLLERSTQGGLHGIVSQGSLLASGNGARIKPNAALFAYIYANLSHDYYISVWDRLTRANPTPSTSTYDYATSHNTSNGIGHFAALGFSSMTALLGSRILGNTVGPRIGSLGNTAATMSASTAMDATGVPTWGAPTGTLNSAFLGTRNDKWTSFVFYRVYIEDLTVSGRTYAEVDAIDYALYTADVLTAGGRYYGDTFTDPATIP